MNEETTEEVLDKHAEAAAIVLTANRTVASEALSGSTSPTAEAATMSS